MSEFDANESFRLESDIMVNSTDVFGAKEEDDFVKSEQEFIVGNNGGMEFEQVHEEGIDSMVQDVHGIMVDSLDRSFYSTSLLGSEESSSFSQVDIREMKISTTIETISLGGDIKAKSMHPGVDGIKESSPNDTTLGEELPEEVPNFEVETGVEVSEKVPEMNISTALETINSGVDKDDHVFHLKAESLDQGFGVANAKTDNENEGGALPVKAPDSEVKAGVEVSETDLEIKTSTTLETTNKVLNGSSLAAETVSGRGEDAISHLNAESLGKRVGVIEGEPRLTKSGDVPADDEVAAVDDNASERNRETVPHSYNEERINFDETILSAMNNDAADTVGDISMTGGKKKSSTFPKEDDNVEPAVEALREGGQLLKADSKLSQNCGIDFEEATEMEVDGVLSYEDNGVDAGFCDNSVGEGGQFVVNQPDENNFVNETQVMAIAEDTPLVEVDDEVMMENEKESLISETTSEVNVDKCLHINKEQLNIATIENFDGVKVGVDSQSDLLLIGNQEVLQGPADSASHESMFVSEKTVELKVGTSGETLVEGLSVSIDCSHAIDKTADLGNKNESISPSLVPMANEPRNVDAHMVSSGEPTASHVSEAVNPDEVIVTEEIIESYETFERNPQEMVLNKCTHDNFVADLDICLDKDNDAEKEDVVLEEGESHMMTDAEFSEYFDGSTNVNGDICLDAEVQETFSADEGDMEMKKHIFEPEQGNDAYVEVSKDIISRPGAQVDLANHLLPEKSEVQFSVSDLVWGKVKNHPWWPGQICDPVNASEKAMQHYKKDSFLVAYFGDRTFAWNEGSVLKPFWSNFSHIEKQSSSEVFQNAINSALDEVSRRIMMGLACSCIPYDIYSKVECQIVENPGIRQESSRNYIVDDSTGVTLLNPRKLVEYVRALAESPSAGTDRLGLVIAKAQLLAFNQMRGYYCLPEFQDCGRLLENGDSDNSVLNQENEFTLDDSYNRELQSGNMSSHKRKHNLKDGSFSSKRKRRLSELIGEEGSVDPDKRISFYAAKVSSTVSPIPKPSFKVGDCIRRAASQLTGSLSILRNGNEKVQNLDGIVDVHTTDNSQTPPVKNSSADEMLLQLQKLARDPVKSHRFRHGVTSFFSGFRDSINLFQYAGRQSSAIGKPGGGKKRKVSQTLIGSPEEFEFDDVSDSYWTGMIIQDQPEEQPGSILKQGHYELVNLGSGKTQKSSQRGNSRKRYSTGNQQELAEDEQMSYIEQRKQANLPSELILNFSEADVPSEVQLNKIFRRFGPLKEAETEINLETSRARVVFKRCSDAEVAFSSARRFSIFGSVCVNYELNYMPSVSFNTFPLATAEGMDTAA